MNKYSEKQKEELVALGKRLGLFDLHSEKVANINKVGLAVKQVNAPKAQQKKHRETQEQFYERMKAKYEIKPLPEVELKDDYDVTNATRYQAVVAWDAGEKILENISNRHRFYLHEQVIQPAEIVRWRKYYLLMNRAQLAALVRVSISTINNWESGKKEIPFSMWWMMHATLQDPAYFLTRPGFHDFYIEYENGEAFLCSHKHPEIRYSPTDLYFNRTVFNDLITHKNKILQMEVEYQKLQTENTNLREMYKTNAVTQELASMHKHLGQLMSRINTADVVVFPEVSSLNINKEHYLNHRNQNIKLKA